MIVHGRRESAVKEAVEYVKGQGNGNGQRVEGIVADLSSLEGMNHLCVEVLGRTVRLDCLLNNAGERRRQAGRQPVNNMYDIYLCSSTSTSHRDNNRVNEGSGDAAAVDIA